MYLETSIFEAEAPQASQYFGSSYYQDAETLWQQPLDIYLLSLKNPKLPPIVMSVVNCLLARMGKKSLDIDSVATELGLTTRTLQRHLSHAHTDFSELRDKVRHQCAIEYIKTGELNVQEISKLLDYKKRCSLTIAFKRWTGYTPRQFGRKHGI